MAEFPALPIFTDAYLGDTRHLTTAQHGAYFLLLMIAWRTADCALPDDDAFLARCVGMDKRTWLNNKAVVLSFWFKSALGKWQQKRLLDERNYVEQIRNKNSEAGKASALKRKNRGSTSARIGQYEAEDNINGLAEEVGQTTRNFCSAAVRNYSGTSNSNSLYNNDTGSTSVQPNVNQTSTPTPIPTSVTESKASVTPPTPIPEKKVSLAELSVDHIREWLAEKRSQGHYVDHDEHFILEQFKNYCQSKGKTYASYPAAYRNAFEWERCQPKQSASGNAGYGKSKHDRLLESAQEAFATVERQRNKGS